MGYIDASGKYHKGKPNLSDLQPRQNNTYKSWSHASQRKDYAREIVQPYTKDGKPNPQFIEAYPTESKDYGFLPSDKDLKEK